jgi:hypothetical protein
LSARTVASFCKSGEKLQKIKGKIENVGAPTFLGRGYPPVLADVGERKEFTDEAVGIEIAPFLNHAL